MRDCSAATDLEDPAGPAGFLRAVSSYPVPVAKATLAALPRQATGHLSGVSEGPLPLSQGRGARQAQALSERHSATGSDDASPNNFLPLLEIQVSGGIQCEDSKWVTWFGHVRGHCAPST